MLDLAIMVLAAAAAGNAPTTTRASKNTIEHAAAPLRLPLESYRKGVAARINVGGKQRLFQLDTAGGVTVISPALAKEIGCRPWGSVSGFHMTGTKITAPRCDGVTMRWGGKALTSPLVTVMEVGTPDTPIDGLLALDAFAGQTITIDFAGRQLIVETSASVAKRVKDATRVPAHLAREIGGAALSVFIEAPTARGPLRLELDSGNGGTLLVSRPLLPSLGLKEQGDTPQHGSIDIAPGIKATGLIFSPDLVIDGNLGMPFLKDWLVTLDLKDVGVWFRHNDVSPPSGMGVPPPVQPS
jgi:hypothetical protein